MPTIIACVWCSRLGNAASSPPLVFSRPPSPPCANGCAVISSKDRAASSNFPALLITSPAKLPPTSNSRSSLCAGSCSLSALAVSSASSIFPSAIVPWSVFGVSMVCRKNARANINANKTSPTSRPPGASFSRSPPTPKTSTISPATGLRPRPSISLPSNTPPARCAAACCSGPFPSAVPRPPVPSLPPAFNSTSNVAAFRSAIWSGRPTTAPSSSAVTIAVATPRASPPLSATASMSAFRPPLPLSRAMSKPSIASSKMSSSTWNRSPAAAFSSPKPSPTSSTSTFVRPNTHKQNLSPWQIVEQLQPRWPLQLRLLPPVFLDYYLNDSGGYDVPRLP